MALVPRIIVVACVATAIALTGNVALLLFKAISPRIFGYLGLVIVLAAVIGLTSLIHKFRQDGRFKLIHQQPSLVRLRMFRLAAVIFPALLMSGWFAVIRQHLTGAELVGPIIGSLVNLGFTYIFISGAMQEKRRLRATSEGIRSA